jgi:hypothetical protein
LVEVIDKKATFANLVVKYGEKNLLDYLDLFASALMVDTKFRKYGRSTYRFMDVKVELVDSKDPLSVIMYGRFVKDTEYTREQVLANGKLVADEMALPVALSAFFCVFLANHRMAYVPEVRNAPPLDAFSSTIEHYLRKEFTTFIDKIYKREKESNPKFTRANAMRNHVSPTVNVVPLPAKQSIRDFVSRFHKINSLTIGLIKRNNEISKGLFQAIVNELEPTGANTAKLIASAGDDGLNIDATAKVVEDTTESGYENVTLKGVDKDGNVLKGGNEEYKLTVDVDDAAPDDLQAKRLYTKFHQMVGDGQISLGKQSDADLEMIKTRLSGLAQAAE